MLRHCSQRTARPKGPPGAGMGGRPSDPVVGRDDGRLPPPDRDPPPPEREPPPPLRADPPLRPPPLATGRRRAARGTGRSSPRSAPAGVAPVAVADCASGWRRTRPTALARRDEPWPPDPFDGPGPPEPSERPAGRPGGDGGRESLMVRAVYGCSWPGSGHGRPVTVLVPSGQPGQGELLRPGRAGRQP